MPSPEMPDFTRYKGVIHKVIQNFPSLKKRYPEEDLVQEVYQELIQAYHGGQFHHGKNINSWVWKVAHNHFLNIIEKESAKRRKSGPLFPLEAAYSKESSTPDPQEVAEQKEKMRKILHTLSRMGGKPRDAVIYHFYDGLTFPEMARRFGTTEDAWRVAFGRGINELARAVTHQKPPARNKSVLRYSKRKKV